jgi:hypothetical protein
MTNSVDYPSAAFLKYAEVKGVGIINADIVKERDGEPGAMHSF